MLFVVDCFFFIWEGVDIIFEFFFRIVDIGIIFGCKVIMVFLIFGYEFQVVIGFVEELVFDIQIKFVGIIELCIRVFIFICLGFGVIGIYLVLIDYIVILVVESCLVSSFDRYLGY